MPASPNSRPVLILTSGDLTLNVGDTYIEPGFTATDNEDGDITGSVVVSGSVNTGVAGVYTLTYNVTDSGGATAIQQTRTITVNSVSSPNSRPVIILSGDSSVTLTQGSSYTDQGATSQDLEDGNITANIVTTGLPINTSVLGTYTIRYNVSDSQSLSALEVTRTVIVQSAPPLPNTRPVITLTGSASVTLTQGSSYTDQGATSQDLEDGNITANIVTTGLPINTSVLGTYTIRYNVSDSQSLFALEVTRTVIVQSAPPLPNTRPVITLTGSASVTLTQGSSYTDQGATAQDNEDGNITANIVTTGLPINTSVLGTYTIRYNVSDSQSLSAIEVTRTVIVQSAPPLPNTRPVITLTGSASVTLTQGSSYTDQGATSQDLEDGNITANIVTTGLPINTSVLGTYTIRYNVSDSQSLFALEVTRTVIVQSAPPLPNTRPVITLTGSASVTLTQGSSYTDQGATSQDLEDGNITANIVTTGLPINTSVLGTYIVRYNVSDSQSLSAIEVTRTVIVQSAPPLPNTRPVITLTGSASVTLTQGSSYTDQGATSQDLEDGNITANIVTTGLPINTSVLGTYTIRYNVSDSQSLSALEVTRTVIVQSAPPLPNTRPVITLTGSASVTLTQGSSYTDQGATSQDLEDGNITSNIVTTGLPINTSVLGTYTIRYNVSDSQSLSAIEVTRTVIVQSAPPLPNTRPVITLTGSASVTLTQGSSYTDQGATSQDLEDGNITANIVTTGLPINTSVLGTYIVRYNVSDSQSLSAIEVTRTVIVQSAPPLPNTRPVITLTGSASVTLTQGSSYTDQGATSQDLEDGNITANIVTTGLPINTSVLGTYIVRYNVSDSQSLSAIEVTRTVIVQSAPPLPNTRPVITLTGSASVTLTQGSSYTDQGATSQDLEDGNITSNIVTTGLPINTSVLGTYIVRYNVSDSQSLSAIEVTRTVIVQSAPPLPNTRPVITLTGSASVTLTQGSSYTDQGATSQDLEDGNITANIVTTGLPINTSVLGTYTVRYNVSDSQSLSALEVTRTVIVQSAPPLPNTRPVITLTGSASVTLTQGSSYTDQGATSQDLEDGNITANIVTTGLPINTSVLGTYTIRYNVSDSQSLSAIEVTRTVIVQSAPPLPNTRPVIILSQEAHLSH